MDFLSQPTRNLFFTGKGGVGKISVASATAIALADQGKRVLLVSTDPASNLDEVFSTKLSSQPTPIEAVPGLSALNINPEASAEAYRQRVLAPLQGVISEAALADQREALSGACTTEIAAFDEFAGLLAHAEEASHFDHILFDTAPTGHTLRLLSLPAAWSDFLETNTRGASCLGPHSALKMRQERFEAALAALTDPALTTLVLVTRPEPTALREAERTAHELQTMGVQHQMLVVNGVFEATLRSDPTALALEKRSHDALAHLPASLQALSQTRLPLQAFNIVGIPALRALLGPSEPAQSPSAKLDLAPVLPEVPLQPLKALVELLAEGLTENPHGLVMVMGKGGVGKTTLAAALSVALAARGINVQLNTTDPAAHVTDAVGGEVPHLTLGRIDPAVETQAYIARILATKGKDLSPEDKALMAEDLRSPCSEEVAVFHAFSRAVAQARRGVVILDTAPTGHTLLLLDATGSYHRQVLQDFQHDFRGDRGRLITPLMRLKDPAYSRIILVTLPETTPVSEAAALQDDLRRAGIEPYAWVVNASLAATGTRDPVLQQRARLELAQLARVQTLYAKRVFTVPWQAEPPVGSEKLRQLATAGG